MYAVASKSALVAAKPVAVRRQARVQVKFVAQEKKQEVAQRRAIFSGLLAAAAVAVLPKEAKAEERSPALIKALCAANPTSKACLENSAKR
mmetsp:Transcript_8758/g.25229  ORF Transcript_8758/g.25229 Transcript_8758/m.25229 type:complete len:91 (+) Transcript_8758:263-535(+)|eukprot:CAMPEP_0117664226 /NCGR_PEP_ID=MMETSP0804-20121206/9093_1 /TAXON_ID=1074897 /ORGANISM="Tetraselmis astigmatica, Strain CCMP880" /LENGTH=90 /DNA_ID=CAMNT_0005471417 /DNA_START=184 /DNA_END=456 /DNA_ORIENTATION=+